MVGGQDWQAHDPTARRVPEGTVVGASGMERFFREHWLGALRAAVIGVAVLALLAGLFLPVYTDEIGWRFQERAGFDGVDKMFSELCGPNTLARPAFFMWPARWYSALFNGLFPAPIWVRLSGILYALAFGALAWRLIRRLTADAGDRLTIPVIGAGLMALGTMPMLAVWSRPEQPVIIAIVAALLIAVSDLPDMTRPTPARNAWLRSAGIAALAAVAASYHLKGLFAAPLLLVCLLFASRGRAAHLPRLVAGGFILVVIALSFAYWKDRLACPGNAALAAEYARNSMGAKVSGVRTLAEAKVALGAMIGQLTIFDYVSLVTPREYPLSNWLEPRQIGDTGSFRWFLVIVAGWALGLILSAVAVLGGLWRSWQARRLDARVALSVMLVVSLLGWSTTQLIRNVYEATFAIPVLMLAVIVALSLRPFEWLRPIFNIAASLIGIAGIASPIALYLVFGPSLVRANAQSGIIAAQQGSTSVWGYDAVRRDVLAAAKACNIPEPARARAVVVDELSYFPYMRSTLPQHMLGVLGGWNGEITDPLAYLRSRQSSGILVECRFVWPELRGRMKQVGRICCMGPIE